MSRRFPAPWREEKIAGGYVVRDANGQASAEHFQQCAEFLPLRNRALCPLVVTVLPIPLASRPTATACAAEHLWH